MKTFASSTLSFQVAAAGEQQLAQCQEQVVQYYGVDDVRYVSQRHFRDGTQMKFAGCSGSPVSALDGYFCSTVARASLEG